MLLILCLLFLSVNATILQDVRNNFGDDQIIAIKSKDINDIAYTVLDKYEVDQLGSTREELHLKIPLNAKLDLEAEGVSFTDHTKSFVENVERNLQSRDFICTDPPGVCASTSLTRFHSSYQKLNSINERFERIAQSNRAFTSLEDIGETYENRTTKILWVDGGLLSGKKLPIIFYFCASHGREWITSMFCTYMAEKLTDASNPITQELLLNFTFAIVPVANPDGYAYSFEENVAWRKTRKPNNGNERCVGADPNRNYEVGFGGPGASRNPCSDTYSGGFPFDQPCVANIKEFVDEYKDRIVHIGDIHSYGEFFLSPFARTREFPADSDKHEQCSQEVYNAIKRESGVEFQIGSFARKLYVASGVSNDYFYSENGITHSYTFEARGGGKSGIDGYQPPVENILPSNLELYAGMVALARCVNKQEILKIPPPEVTCRDEIDVCSEFDCQTSQRPLCEKTCGECGGSGGTGGTIFNVVDSSNDTILIVGLIVLSMVVINMGIYIVVLNKQLNRPEAPQITIPPTRGTLSNTSEGLDHYGL